MKEELNEEKVIAKYNIENMRDSEIIEFLERRKSTKEELKIIKKYLEDQKKKQRLDDSLMENPEQEKAAPTTNEPLHTINNGVVNYQKSADDHTQRPQANVDGDYDMDAMMDSPTNSNEMEHTSTKTNTNAKVLVKTKKQPPSAPVQSEAAFASIPLLILMLGTVLTAMVGIAYFLINNG